MPKLALYNMEGSKVGDIEVSDAIFAHEINKVALHQVVVNYLANQRQGTQSTKTRSEVRGGGIKPWRQKGTGRARQGSTRSPQWTGGGVVFAPKPRSYRTSVNKKIKQLAMRSALSSKLADNEMLFLDNIEVSEVKTKTIAEMLKNLNVTEKTLIVLSENNEKVYLSARNIPGVGVSYVGMVNVYELLKYKKVIMVKDAAEKLGEVYA